MRRTLTILSVSAAIFAAACTEPYREARIEQAKFAPELGVNLDVMTRTESGLYYADLVTGTGTTLVGGMRADVYYYGHLADGRFFDQRAEPESPFSFIVGIEDVIVGFDEGVLGMRVGGKRLLIIPPALGYGRSGLGPVPGNAILVFLITLQAAQ